jgi:hypothetical protein
MLDCCRASGSDTVEPVYVDVVVRVIGELIFIWDMFPGRFAVDGVRFNRGLSVGGRGAGPGFIN